MTDTPRMYPEQLSAIEYALDAGCSNKCESCRTNLRSLIAEVRRLETELAAMTANAEHLRQHALKLDGMLFEAQKDIKAMTAERDALKEPKGYICTFCGTTTCKRDDTEPLMRMAEHIAVCENHPMHSLIEENISLRAEVERLKSIVSENNYGSNVPTWKAIAQDSEAEVERLTSRLSLLEAVLVAGEKVKRIPNHCHKIAGIWDEDNGTKSGTRCEECENWNEFHEALTAARSVSKP